MAEVFRRGETEFSQLPDGSYMEHDTKTGWLGTSSVQHGLATGRPAPHAAVRERKVTSLLRAQGLASDPDVAGPGHGVLFDPKPYVHAPAEVMRAAGVPERRLSSGEGFLPRLGSVAGASPERRAEVSVDKQLALRQASRITGEIVVNDTQRAPEWSTNASIGPRGTSTPMATQITNRRKFVSDDIEGDWYKTESADIGEAAYRSGVSQAAMRRGVAYTSPQKPWNTGNAQDSDVKYPNIEAAEAVANTVTAGRRKAANEGRGFDWKSTAETTRVPAAGGEGVVMPQSRSNMRHAARVFAGHESPGDAIRTAGEVSEKVPNFDLALARGSDSLTARREATQAYTADTWDVRSAGIGDYAHIGGGGLTRERGGPAPRPTGQYDIIATTGRRAGLKEDMLPSEMQQHVWRGVRRSSGTAPTTQALLRPDKHTGQERVVRS